MNVFIWFLATYLNSSVHSCWSLTKSVGITKPIITPRGAQSVIIAVAFAFSYEGNQIVATFEGMLKMKVYENPPSI